MLSDLTAAYEDEHHAIEPASDSDMLRHLMAALRSKRNFIVLRQRYPCCKAAEPAEKVLSVRCYESAAAANLFKLQALIHLIGRNREVSFKIASQCWQPLICRIEFFRGNFDTMISLILVLNYALPNVLTLRHSAF